MASAALDATAFHAGYPDAANSDISASREMDRRVSYRRKTGRVDSEVLSGTPAPSASVATRLPYGAIPGVTRLPTTTSGITSEESKSLTLQG
jgi:hypothetical protein